VSGSGHGPARKGKDDIKEPIEEDADFVQMPEETDVINAPEGKTAAEGDPVNVVPEYDVTDNGKHERCDWKHDPND
jgi:hypothetical protein